MEQLQLIDFLKYRYPSAVALSPDGKRAAFAVKSIDPEQDCYAWSLWIYDLDAGTCTEVPGGTGQRKAVWDDSAHLLIIERQPDPELLAQGIEASWSTLSRLDPASGEKEQLFRLPVHAAGVWPAGNGTYIITAETHLDQPNLLTMEPEERAREAARRLHTKG